LSGNALRELTLDRNGFIWTATWDKGLNKFDPVTEQFARYQHEPNNADSVSHDSVTYTIYWGSGVDLRTVISPTYRK